ncbi:MAG: NUDIX domain-containing protein [Burkholderiaceae bacterium]
MRSLVLAQLKSIDPATAVEAEQLDDAISWVESGAPLCRVEKPATPRKHLVSYFPVVDGEYILLVDHRNAMRWLPPGGHVETGEDPRTTVVRELREELGLEATVGEIPEPLMVSVTETVGHTSGHTDVSLWYTVRRSRSEPLCYDEGEFKSVRWFSFSEVPYERTDPNLERFIAKLRAEA